VGTATYLWTFGDGGTTTVMNPNHTYAASGNYTVCLIATDTCASDTLCQQVTVQLVGTADPSNAMQISAWPNPATDELHVSTTLMDQGQLELIDLTGRVLARMPLAEGRQEHMLDLRLLAQGMYYLRLESQGVQRRLPITRQ
jgi:hypothetical protein